MQTSLSDLHVYDHSHCFCILESREIAFAFKRFHFLGKIRLSPGQGPADEADLRLLGRNGTPFLGERRAAAVWVACQKDKESDLAGAAVKQ